MLPLKPDRPIKIVDKIPPVEDVIIFFQNFAPQERIFKVIFLTQLMTGLRINETCHIQLCDLSDNCTRLIFLPQKKKDNEPREKHLPETLAAILRNWIKDNLYWIQLKGGYLFPHKSNNKYLHKTPLNARNFLMLKRKQLAFKYPDRSFGDVISYVDYDDIGNLRSTTRQPIFLWRTHLFRKLFASFVYEADKNPVLIKELLAHTRVDVTDKFYIRGIERQHKERVLLNQIFNENFFDKINDKKENVIAVWQKLNQYKKEKLIE